QFGQAPNDGLVVGVRPLTSGEDKQSRIGIPSGLAGDLEKCFPHGYAGYFSVAEVLRRFLEMDGRSRDPPRHHAIGKAGHYVGFERQGWSSLEDRRQHSWAGGVPANSNHNIGLEFCEDTARIPDRAGKIKQSLEPRLETDLVERAHLDESQGEA